MIVFIYICKWNEGCSFHLHVRKRKRYVFILREKSLRNFTQRQDLA